MKTKRVLFLGGAYFQVPIIREAKSRGYYIITCDYLPNNPGHKLADEYYNISTTDFERVLTIAKKVNPDFIIAFATDAASETVAYVSEKLGLPANSVESVRILSNKDLFRDFQKKHKFNAPESVSIREYDNALEKIEELKFPIMVKPSDSSGSKGISKVERDYDVQSALDLAISFSRNKRIVAEEFIECDGAQLHGDGFVKDGNLIFVYLGDHHYNTTINPFVPFSTTWPSIKPENTIRRVENEINRLLKEVGFMNGPINIEVRIDKEGKIFIGEIAPRSGGNFSPQAIFFATGFDMIKATLDVLSFTEIVIETSDSRFSSNYVIHTGKEGKLKKLMLKEEIKPFLKEFHQYIQKGEMVKSFQNSSAAIGLLILQFGQRESMDYYISNMDKYIEMEFY